MHGENREEEIREIESEIKKDLREVEKLEEKLETLTGDSHEHNHKHHHHHKVTVTVDNTEHSVESGSYVVAKFKELVKVPSSKVLEEIIHGELTPLDDNALLEIKGGEVFISHVRTGGSSQ